jgi:hypothetical protein
MPETEQHFDPEQLLTVHDLACLTGTAARLIERMVSLDLIEPTRNRPQPCFRSDALARVRKIRRLHVELGVSWSSMGVVLDLLERIEELESGVGPDTS